MSAIAWSSAFSPLAGLDIESELRQQQLDSVGGAELQSGSQLSSESTPIGRAAVSPVPQSGRDPAISLTGIAKKYGAREVLSNFDMQIERGSFVAIVGRSGCGKSTLLRLLAGLEQADGGSLRTSGQEGPLQTRMMFQEARLLPWKSVLDNVMLGLPRRNAGQSIARARAVLDEVGLSDRANDWPAQLSGGQRQRVALARALVHRPELLLLDEPLGALDALTRIEMHALIERLWREHGFTAVLVTHDVHEAVALGDRVVLIEHGRIALDQAVTLARPRARETAAFAALEGRVLQRVLQAEPGAPGADLSVEESAVAAHGVALSEVRWAI